MPKCLVLEKILYENVEFKEENELPCDNNRFHYRRKISLPYTSNWHTVRRIISIMSVKMLRNLFWSDLSRSGYTRFESRKSPEEWLDGGDKNPHLTRSLVPR